ncbi:hypothetical protein EDB19DRAFT_1728293 [Suillus lakei]|nr:hypothetical protein EDB19DRAFT_1728293 [Suillus lakei]
MMQFGWHVVFFLFLFLHSENPSSQYRYQPDTVHRRTDEHTVFSYCGLPVCVVTLTLYVGVLSCIDSVLLIPAVMCFFRLSGCWHSRFQNPLHLYQ